MPESAPPGVEEKPSYLPNFALWQFWFTLGYFQMKNDYDLRITSYEIRCLFDIFYTNPPKQLGTVEGIFL